MRRDFQNKEEKTVKECLEETVESFTNYVSLLTYK